MTVRYQPFVTVACVVQSGDKYLLVEEIAQDNAGHITFNQPAGHLEANETLIEAAQRELLEETGLVLGIDQFIGVYQYFLTDKQFVRFTFYCNIEHQTTITPQDPQIIAGHWLTLAQIKQRKAQLRSPLVIKSIEDYISHGSIPADNRLMAF